MSRSKLLIAGLAFAACVAHAATPDSGALTTRDGVLDWTGGPFIVPNVTNVIGYDSLVEDAIQPNSVCEEETGQTCDVFRFEIGLDGIDDEEDLLIISVEWENTVAPDDDLPPDPSGLVGDPRLPDFDLELYDDETGDLIATKGSGDENPEVLKLGLINGKYRLVVIPYAPFNATYKGNIRLSTYTAEDKSGGLMGGALSPSMLLLGLAVLLRRRLAATLAAGLLVAAPGAQAATPSSGTIDDTNASAEWDGGPFVFPNQTNIIQIDSLAEDVIEENSICEEETGQTCDVYRFEVNLSAPIDEDDDFLMITVSWPDNISGDDAQNMPDYDLELYNDETGELVKQQATAANPEVLTTALANGKYRLVVIPYAPMNEPYHGVVTYSSYSAEDKSLLGAGNLGGGSLGAGTLAALFLALAGARRRRTR